MAANEGRIKNIETEATLNYAVLALLKSKTIENITVSNICEKAQVNRAVFYAYFPDKYALINHAVR